MPRLRVGDTIENFFYENAKGEKKLFFDLLTGPSILWFMRYVGCTACQVDLHDLEQLLPELERQGIVVAVVLQSTPDSIARQRPEGFPFEVICDPDRVLYRKFEVPCAKSRMTMLSVGLPKKLSRAKSLGLQHGEYEGSELQLPALFLINNEGKLLYTRYAKTLTDLPAIEDLPNMMRMLNKKKTPLTEPR